LDALEIKENQWKDKAKSFWRWVIGEGKEK
jgi:hypothetical protein